MHAHKLRVTIQEDHRVEVRLPDDFPEGPAEVIVLTNWQAGDAQPSPEEKEVLDALPRFQIRAFVDGLQPGIDPDKMNQLLDQLEVEDIARKLRG
ncbi:MAG: hypothetical protein QOH06_4189 [Acidobacteriota bacterium]|nr:hypothetical protein [Acidobacteriota bacterium]